MEELVELLEEDFAFSVELLEEDFAFSGTGGTVCAGAAGLTAGGGGCTGCCHAAPCAGPCHAAGCCHAPADCP